MICPPDIAAILLEIIGNGILVARFAGHAGDAALPAVEADHVHNLPSVIMDYSPARLRYYWNIERRIYLDSQALGYGFQPLWDRLRLHVEC